MLIKILKIFCFLLFQIQFIYLILALESKICT